MDKGRQDVGLIGEIFGVDEVHLLQDATSVFPKPLLQIARWVTVEDSDLSVKNAQSINRWFANFAYEWSVCQSRGLILVQNQIGRHECCHDAGSGAYDAVTPQFAVRRQ